MWMNNKEWTSTSGTQKKVCITNYRHVVNEWRCLTLSCLGWILVFYYTPFCWKCIIWWNGIWKKKLQEFYATHPGAPWWIHLATFQSLSFCALRIQHPRKGGDVRGHQRLAIYTPFKSQSTPLPKLSIWTTPTLFMYSCSHELLNC